ncbi:MAG TPA: hypothetical protein VLL07_02695, partial [Pontiella sp.]|nr:hypothetical protein [Pontiella sp.]
TIIPDNQEKWKDHPDFENKTSDGKHYATLGAASKKDNGKLKSKMNRESDVERGENVFETAVRIPEGMTEDEYIQLMIDTDENYNDDETYSALPNKNKKEGYNSNSYTAGLIDATGGTIEEDPPDAPGFDKPLPKEAFSDTKEEATEPNQSQTLPGSNINAH